MRKVIYLALGCMVLPLLTLSTSTAPMGFSLAYWAHKFSTDDVGKRS
jgi:predicted membrane channel-forming protein YqfA (hemolysin III family)